MDTSFINNKISISRKAVDLCVSYILNPWLRDLYTDFALNSCFYESVELTNNAVLDKYKQRLQHRTCFSFRIFIYRWKRGKNTIISEVHLFILILTTGAKYPLNFTQSGKRFVLSLYFNGSKSFFSANISCFPRRFQRNTFRLPRRLEDVLKTCLQVVLQLYLQDIFKTSWKTKKCYTEDVFKTSSRRLQYIFTKTNVCWIVC